MILEEAGSSPVGHPISAVRQVPDRVSYALVLVFESQLRYAL